MMQNCATYFVFLSLLWTNVRPCVLCMAVCHTLRMYDIIDIMFSCFVCLVHYTALYTVYVNTVYCIAVLCHSGTLLAFSCRAVPFSSMCCVRCATQMSCRTVQFNVPCAVGWPHLIACLPALKCSPAEDVSTVCRRYKDTKWSVTQERGRRVAPPPVCFHIRSVVFTGSHSLIVVVCTRKR